MSRYILGLGFMCGIALMGPMHAHAAVLIHEIAWMGTAVDNGSFCEWVELTNTGTEAVSLSGWTLKTADGGMSVSLSGTIAPAGFVLVERSTPTACPDPVPGIADIIKSFGGGLSNSGEILLLLDGNTEVDRVDGSDGWSFIGGDADEKYTAQRNGDGWVTAVATPGAVNATESVVAAESSSSSDSTSSKTVTNPIPKLYIEGGDDRVVTTKAHVTYQAAVYGSDKKVRRVPRLSWAFGDGSRSLGTKVEHAYKEPGEYLVVLRAQEGFSAGTHSFVVIAEPAKVAITALSEQGISIQNQDDRILDLSNWRLAANEETFRIPRDTQILPGRTVIFPSQVTGLLATTSATLMYPNEEIAAVYGEEAVSTQPQAQTDGSHIVKTVEPLEPAETTAYDAATLAPAAAHRGAAAGALTAPERLWALISALWPKSSSYRTLSISRL